jgi:hypothetical protein
MSRTTSHGVDDIRTQRSSGAAPRRQMHQRVVEEALACGELKPDTNPELLIDALYALLPSAGCRGKPLSTRHLPKPP